MTSYKLVMPEHMNQYGYLFGGYLLQWVDETAWMAVSLEHPGMRFVTVGMSQVAFHKPARRGAILRFETEAARAGNTSATYAVRVFHGEDAIFGTEITFVRIDGAGRKLPLSAPADA